MRNTANIFIYVPIYKYEYEFVCSIKSLNRYKRGDTGIICILEKERISKEYKSSVSGKEWTNFVLC